MDNVSPEGLDSNGDCYPTYPNKHLGHGSKESINKLKGIVPRQNGSWGSKMYVNSHQIWLGTVKSKKEPEMAHESVTIQLRCAGSHQNFPWTDFTVEEPSFMSQYSQEAVLEMIRGGSCQPIFQGHHRDNYGKAELGICGPNLSAMQRRGGFSCKLLFRKMLTPSDVGRLNRIVIPKKNATTCFSEISGRMEEDAKVGVVTDVQVDFFDRMMRCWKFRYCFWKSSQSYVFTRGWSRFVKDNQLKVNDVVAFYLCEVQREGKIVDKFFMIDPVRGEESVGNGSSSSVIEVSDHNAGLKPEMLTSVFEGTYHNNVGLRPKISSSSVFEGASCHHHNVEKKLGEEVTEVDPPSNVERKGFRLFGVKIN
ncbi:AP2/ERF and B3 domain-containing transcription factor At1g50680-like [Prosopis cineraria]|uniref:AP2/ERF and B3 domain-containing transcription factor At1g50680-like n=1 Tax=Prosopis cineraria TaxID=364024 RepID=UPI00240FAC4C|nr:AP2/ERF and B3 domain-containing transcription factor At1g50680-like [Prosopis cineraria]XP_054821174.1 AP2/ERF and B3 domain-containing transcription factor At1g50680-like [Prosopis cineraria]XP_054821175.1 AP2/ERF and B3 domain-containing transcription factor At1g50680-like [Prosopis cineraria]XP_054821176.1 AP2/ERF and B3 domain-containing transcription factor At1g50680-like [Prosopis cineraria]XP_054821177.1 AP2/ERF and B3 domain-containing transcription factor At1g50680-like [Prosopis c